jgi:hypothetical protein
MSAKELPKEISLRPYNGRLFVARTKKKYTRVHKALFNTPDLAPALDISTQPE